jgi:beta-fructofuranosidase
MREPPDYHLFHLQAPRTPENPELRHNAARIGHAVSTDLLNWRDEGEVLAPGKSGEWDDLSVWTGSVIRHGDVYCMLYTARSWADQGAIQRIGLAQSDDLFHWEKHPKNPLMEADARYYEKFDDSGFMWESWRDPYLYYNSVDRQYYAFITARESEGELDERGCVGAARSSDLVGWEVLPPVCRPRKFADMEVPQLFEHGGRSYMLFSTNPFWYAESYRSEIDFEPWEGDHYMVADSPLGEYRIVGDGILSRDNAHAYASKIVPGPSGDPVLLSWLSKLPGDDEFAGVLSHPHPISFDSTASPQIVLE